MCFQKKEYANRNNFTVFATVQNQQQYGKNTVYIFLFIQFILLIDNFKILQTTTDLH